MSIWDGVGRKTFEDKIARLQAKAPGQHITISKLKSNIVPVIKQRELRLPAEVEKRLADGFAFLAATEDISPYVAAATVSACTESVGLSISIAANEGIKLATEEAFHNLCVELRGCASGRKAAVDLSCRRNNWAY